MKQKSDMYKLKHISNFVVLVGILSIILLFIASISSAKATELFKDTEVSYNDDCGVTSETQSMYQEVFIRQSGWVTEFKLWLSQDDKDGSFSIMLFAENDDQTEVYVQQFESGSELDTDWQLMTYDFEPFWVDKDSIIRIYLNPYGSIRPNALNWRYEHNDPYADGEGYCPGLITQNADFDVSVWGVKHNTFLKWLTPTLIPTAFASTTCEYVVSGATTTATCSDASMDNPSANIFFGLVLFFIMFFGLIMFFKR